MESTIGMWIVVAMIYDVVVVTFLEHAVVSWTMNGSIGIGLEDSSVVGIRTEWTLGCGVIYAVAGILAMLAGVEEVVDAVALEDERSLEERGFSSILRQLPCSSNSATPYRSGSLTR